MNINISSILSKFFKLLGQQLLRCHRWGRRWCRSLWRWCTARCNLQSPPTAAESPRFPPTSDCRNHRQFQTSRAWQQRSYLNNVCVGQRAKRDKGEEEGGKYNRHQIEQRATCKKEKALVIKCLNL